MLLVAAAVKLAVISHDIALLGQAGHHFAVAVSYQNACHPVFAKKNSLHPLIVLQRAAVVTRTFSALRYRFVSVYAVANAEKAKEKLPAEQSGFSVVKNAKSDKTIKKPIVKAIDEIVEGKVYVLKNGEGYKTEGFEKISAIEEALGAEEI